jgi:hypothetical protein
MTDDLDILAQIDAFCARHDLAETRFGRMALHDPSFVYRLRAGADVRRSTIMKIRKWMADYRPSRPRRRAEGNAVAA